MLLKMVNGDRLELVRQFETNRALVYLEPGVPVIAIRVQGTDTWDADTGEPALPAEEAFIKSLLPDGTTVTATDPDGNVTTFKDE